MCLQGKPNKRGTTWNEHVVNRVRIGSKRQRPGDLVTPHHVAAHAFPLQARLSKPLETL